MINLVLQNQWNNCIDKTCGCRPFFYCKALYEEEMNNQQNVKTTNKKRPNVVESVTSIFFVMKDPFKKIVV
jgi:hypothetical protein